MWEFLKSANKPDSWLQTTEPEILFWGRSNVGKSSLLNALASQTIARVSSTPGRTRLLNYFKTTNNRIVVDLPGYGYGKMSASLQAEISQMISDYLHDRANIETVCILIDSRIGITPVDSEMINLCLNLNLHVDLIVTKTDKCNQKELHKTRKDISDLYSNLNVFFVSSKTKRNLDKITEHYKF